MAKNKPVKQLVSKNMEKVARSLFSDASEQQRFLQALVENIGGVTGVVWLKRQVLVPQKSAIERPSWLPEWIDIAEPTERPGRSEYHEQGEIYCMDLSSAFACAALSAISDSVSTIVDMCASPGGKGIVARSYLNPGLLIGNEVIGKRTAQLISNYKRCRIDPSVVTSLDPQILGEAIPGGADLVIVDAPCSGQSLVSKGLAAPGAFHPAAISMNERRQRRILAHSGKVVAPGGYLLYSTCTFSHQENERNIEWFAKTFPEFSCMNVAALEPYRSHLSELPSYRLFPHQGIGAGAFCAILRRGIDDGVGDGVEHSVEDRVSNLVSLEDVTERVRTVWRSQAVSHDTTGSIV